MSECSSGVDFNYYVTSQHYPSYKYFFAIPNCVGVITSGATGLECGVSPGAGVTSETRVCDSVTLGDNYTWVWWAGPGDAETPDHYRLRLTPWHPLTTLTWGQQIGPGYRAEGRAVLINVCWYSIFCEISSRFSSLVFIFFLSPTWNVDKIECFFVKNLILLCFCVCQPQTRVLEINLNLRQSTGSFILDLEWKP